VPTDWSGDVLLLHGTSAGTGADIAQLDVRGRGMTAIANSTFDETDARWSSDQAWLAYVSDERGERDVYVRAWPRARLSPGLAGTNVAEGRRVSFGGGAKPRWGHDGRTLFFQRGEQIMRVVRNADGSFTNAAPVARLPGLRDFDAAHRSPRLVALTATSEAAPHPPRVFADWMR
jgi:Tol biopolymer transport system component